MKNNKTILVLAMICLLFTVIPMTQAFGVTSSYWKDRPLYLNPGESKTISFELQNMVGTDSYTIKADIEQGSEIAALANPSGTYQVPAGTKDTKVDLNINIPESAQANSIYKIAVAFDTVNTQTGGIITGAGIVKSFDIIVTGKVAEEAEPQTSPILIGILVFVVIAAVVAFIIIKSSRKK